MLQQYNKKHDKESELQQH